ncbi:MAG: SPFH domain-containing protein [archaeon]
MSSEKKQKQGIFLLILIAMLLFFVIGLFFYKDLIEQWPWLALLSLFLIAIWRFDFLITLKDYERAIVFRFGKVNRVGGPGWIFILPPVESFTKVDLRTKTTDVPKQDVITKDSIEVRIDAILYLRIKKDPQSIIKSVIEVEDYNLAAQNFIMAALRNKIGNMLLSDVIANINSLNEELAHELKLLIEGWGLDVVDVEIKEVQIPRKIIEAMHDEKAAVQEKLARMERAKAQAEEINAVSEATKSLSQDTLNYYYIKALEEMARGKSTKLIFPLEISKIVHSLSSNISSSDSPNLNNLMKNAEPYKKMLQGYVEDAVKKAKIEEKKKEIDIEEK